MSGSTTRAVVAVVGIVLATIAIALIGTILIIPESKDPQTLNVTLWEDPANGVTCYVWNGDDFDGGISCVVKP